MRNIILVCGTQLGDTGFGLAGAKWFKQHGYIVSCLINSDYESVFQYCSFIDYPIFHKLPLRMFMENSPHAKDIAEGIVQRVRDHINLLDGTIELCCPLPIVWHWEKILDAKLPFPHRSSLPTGKRVCSHMHRGLCNVGIPPFLCFPEFGIPISDQRNSVFKVGVTNGSWEKARRMDMKLVNFIGRELTRNGFDDIYFFGLIGHDEVVPDAYYKKTGNDILEVLKMLSQMNLLITPDSGLLHAALYFRIPIIFIQSMSTAEHIFDKLYDDIYVVRSKNLTCLRNCFAQTDEACSKNKNDVFNRFNDIPDINWKSYINQMKPINHLQCKDEFSHTVQCINNIQVQEIIDITLDLKNKFEDL